MSKSGVESLNPFSDLIKVISISRGSEFEICMYFHVRVGVLISLTKKREFTIFDF